MSDTIVTKDLSPTKALRKGLKPRAADVRAAGVTGSYFAREMSRSLPR
jgi:hypothetical protein